MGDTEMREGQRLLKGRAKVLRGTMTDTEQRLWHSLRGKQLDGYRFRRQVVMGNYIADFVCLERRLVVEVDGGQHQSAAQYDSRRDAYLESLGYRVLRFWNNEVLGNLAGVLEKIRGVLASPLPSPPPQAGEGMVDRPAFPTTESVAAKRLPPPPAGEGWGGGTNP